MGYFANGTEGDMYHEEYCSKCAHSKNQEFCPIISLHVLYSYKLCNEDDHPGKVMLDTLIPLSDAGPWNDKCSMFIESNLDKE